jgi:indolepyruvate ferredoxin oxidoreductase alpha subunit
LAEKEKFDVMRRLMSGNEAIARGAYECGVSFASGYPGTPSTEILEEYSRYAGVYAEWSPNEKVALEVGIGAALAGARALVTMKHVGVNVAADPLFTVSYTGIKGGLVIVTADDPSLHSSQNEQDNRNYAKFARIPMFEPADSQEAKEFTKIAFDVSERFDTPVFLRSTTRVSHSQSIVFLNDRVEGEDKTGIFHDPLKYVMVPARARVRRIEIEKRMAKLREYAESFPENRMELNDPAVGIITSGMSYNYAKDAFPYYSYLKLGMVYPPPLNLIREFASKVDKLYVVEELDPFFEEAIKATGIAVIGKDIFPYTGEFDPGIVKTSIEGTSPDIPDLPDLALPPRPPNLCPGCPHRGLFYVLGKLGAFVAGDIGCYTLSFMKPLEGMDSTICMGASIGMAHGMSKALKEKGRGKVVGVIGDSTFTHSGIAPLLNMAYNKSAAVVVISDNSTTAMTGLQDHAATGMTLQGEITNKLDFISLAQSMGIESIRVIDPYDIAHTKKVMKEELDKDCPSLVISKGACVLLRKKRKEKPPKPFIVDPAQCIGCKMCLNLGCPAISWKSFTGNDELKIYKKGKKQEGVSSINPVLCTGCTLCRQVCKPEAIGEVKSNG